MTYLKVRPHITPVFTGLCALRHVGNASDTGEIQGLKASQACPVLTRNTSTLKNEGIDVNT